MGDDKLVTMPCDRHRINGPGYNPFCDDCIAATSAWAAGARRSFREIALVAHSMKVAEDERKNAERRSAEQEAIREQQARIEEMIKRTQLPVWFPGVEFVVVDLGVNGADALIAPETDTDLLLGIRQYRPMVYDAAGKLLNAEGGDFDLRGADKIRWPGMNAQYRETTQAMLDKGQACRPVCDCNQGDGIYHAHYGGDDGKYMTVARMVHDYPFSCARCRCDYLAMTELTVGEIQLSDGYPRWSGTRVKKLSDIGAWVARRDERNAS